MKIIYEDEYDGTVSIEKPSVSATEVAEVCYHLMIAATFSPKCVAEAFCEVGESQLDALGFSDND